MNKKIKIVLEVMLTIQINVKGKVDIFIINIFYLYTNLHLLDIYIILNFKYSKDFQFLKIVTNNYNY